MSIKAKFDTWIREDRLYNPKHLTSNEYDVCRRWFERGYNESLLDIQLLAELFHREIVSRGGRA